MDYNFHVQNSPFLEGLDILPLKSRMAVEAAI